MQGQADEIFVSGSPCLNDIARLKYSAVQATTNVFWFDVLKNLSKQPLPQVLKQFALSQES